MPFCYGILSIRGQICYFVRDSIWVGIFLLVAGHGQKATAYVACQLVEEPSIDTGYAPEVWGLTH